MRIALIAPPFVAVPPKTYGGTELFIAQLAEGLQHLGYEAVVYANGESTVNAPVRWLYPKGEWPIQGEVHDNLKDLNHTAWAIADAARDCDIIHLNNAPGLASSRFVHLPFVYTIHHPQHNGLSAFYNFFPSVYYVTISDFQRRCESMPRLRTIHHGIDLSPYRLREGKRDYLAFLGRIAPMKGAHLAIEAAKKAGIPLKIAGEVQPIFREYYERQIKPKVDGKFIEYIGEVGLEGKNQLLGNARALLFPIQWDEPFGLVMIEAMACGAPVLALPGGSVREVVSDGVSGHVCGSVDELAERARELALAPRLVRDYVQKSFSIEQMVKQYAQLYGEMLSGRSAELAAHGELVTTADNEDDSGNPDGISNRAVA